MNRYFVPVTNRRSGEKRLLTVSANSAEEAQHDGAYKAFRELGWQSTIAETPKGPRARRSPRTR